jgi:hypothetical protein
MGSSAPAPPPDYTPQKADWSAQQTAQRQQQAQGYNDQIAGFNTQLSNLANPARQQAQDTLSIGLDAYGDIQNHRRNLLNVQSQLWAHNWNQPTPNWDSVVQSPYGAVSVEVPGMGKINTQDRDSALNMIQNALSHLDGLQQQFRQEENNINQFKSNIFGGATGISSALGHMGIGDMNAINNQRTQLDMLKAQLAGFTSPISNFTQTDDNWLARINPTIQQAEANLQALLARRAAEESRVNSFGQQLFGTLGGIEDRLSGLTIADKAMMDQLQQQLRQANRQGMSFSSELPFNFSAQQMMGQDIGAQLQNLYAQRSQEEQRIQQAQQMALMNSGQLANQSRMANVYDGNLIQALMGDIGMMRDEKSGFSSLLPFDFTRSNSHLNNAEAQLQTLLQGRQRHFDRFGNQLSELESAFGGIDPWNESALRDQQSRAMMIQNQLGRFTGNDTMDMDFRVQDKLMNIDNSLRNLMTQRQQLQQQAQQMLQRIQEESYLNEGQVMGDKDQLKQMREQAQLYNAQQALAEINRAMQHLQGEKSRLNTDALNVSKAQQTEQNQVLQMLGPNGLPTFYNTPLTEYMTPEQYLALLQNNAGSQDNEQEPIQTSTFSSSLGF